MTALAIAGCTVPGEGATPDAGAEIDAAVRPVDAAPSSFHEPLIEHRTLANDNWGYPSAGDTRRMKPTILMVVHMFGVESTAAMPVGIGPGTGTNQEYTAISKPTYTRNSAHDYIARNGDVIEVIDPAPYAAWSNGALMEPNVSIATINVIASQTTRNPNEFCYREVECTAYPGTFPVNDAQKETVAYFVARDSITTGLPINRQTVTTHADFDSVTRANCAFPPSKRELLLAGIIERANVIKSEMLQAP
jgi:hypothetical protein